MQSHFRGVANVFVAESRSRMEAVEQDAMERLDESAAAHDRSERAIRVSLTTRLLLANRTG
jgi:hypothetical protein